MKSKRKLISLGVVAVLILIFLSTAAFAVPSTINYQGRLADSGGAPVNTTVSMTFSIYNASSGGAALWTETQSSVTVIDGAFSVTLGIFNALDLPFDEQYYLGVQVETDAEMEPRAVLLSVPYAMRAGGVETPLELSEATSVAVIKGTNTGTGRAGEFRIDNSDSSGYALYAQTNGSGNAVYGYNTGTGRAGVFRISNATSFNEALYARTNGTGYSGYFYGGAGVFVDGDLDVTGTIYGDGSGIYGISVGSHNHDTDYVNVDGDMMTGTLNLNTSSSGTNALSAATTGTGFSGYFSGGSGVSIWGNLFVSGAITKGSGNFVQPHPTDPSKELVYAFFEGPEHAVFLRGKARLVDGRAVIETPEYFRLVAGRDEEITVQFTPRSSDTFGLAAVEVTRERIVVEELKGETHSYEFDYFITAKRAGFEGHEPIQPNTHFTADMKTAEDFEQAYAKDDITSTAMRKLLISNGILTADGKLNMELAKELGWVVKDYDVAVK